MTLERLLDSGMLLSFSFLAFGKSCKSGPQLRLFEISRGIYKLNVHTGGLDAVEMNL